MATAGSARLPRTWRSTPHTGELSAMILSALFFYLFAAMCVGAGFMVVAARNPVHAVLFLILTFFNAAGLFVLLGAEFLAMILVVVYVGAVLVLFLFVVMMLDIDFAELRAGFLKYLPMGAVIGVLFLVELLFIFGTWVTAPEIAPQAPMTPGVGNTAALGRILYTDYVYLFEAAGMILLVAMIGAIVLTLHHREKVRRQSIDAQVARTRATGLEVVKVESGRGLS
jgi:NADH-quinone oxidoreductase subunit J